MRSVFVDTVGWGSIVDRNQPYHQPAANLYRHLQELNQNDVLVTTNYVLAELVSLLISPLRFPHQHIVEYMTSLNASHLLETVYIDRDLHERALSLFAARPDKFWSLVDCTSFIVMQDRKITAALTTDHHFEQAGFVRLLK